MQYVCIFVHDEEYRHRQSLLLIQPSCNEIILENILSALACKDFGCASATNPLSGWISYKSSQTSFLFSFIKEHRASIDVFDLRGIGIDWEVFRPLQLQGSKNARMQLKPPSPYAAEIFSLFIKFILFRGLIFHFWPDLSFSPSSHIFINFLPIQQQSDAWHPRIQTKVKKRGTKRGRGPLFVFYCPHSLPRSVVCHRMRWTHPPFCAGEIIPV